MQSIRALLRDWLISFLGWGLVAAAVGTQFLSGSSLPWTSAIIPGIRDWLPWAVLTPLLFRLTAAGALRRGGATGALQCGESGG